MASAPPSNPAGLIPGPLQQLSVDDVADLAARFTAVTMDANLRTVANTFAEAVICKLPASDVDQRWHHLVMTAGNFKRQAPILLFQLQPMVAGPCPPFQLPGAPPNLPKITPTSGYEALTGITGIGVPTASTILSVLWPDEHLIIDRFDVYTAVGLALANQPGSIPEDQLKAWVGKGLITWGDYEWLREVARQTLGLFAPGQVSLLQLEKALFELYQMRRASRRSEKWAPFVKDLGKVLQRCPGCMVFGFQQHQKGCLSARCNTHNVPYGTKPCLHRSPAGPAWRWVP